MGYVIIPKPNLSNHEGIYARCHRFELLFFAVFTQSVAVVTAAVAVQVVAVLLAINYPYLPFRLSPFRSVAGGQLNTRFLHWFYWFFA